MAPALKAEPPDLTRLALRNDGTFPRARLEAVVTGSADPPLSVHGSREMPVWGPIFSALDRDEALNRVRIANILDYLETLQLRYAAIPTSCPRRISLLTGSGFDATDGVQCVKARGGTVIVQDPETAEHSGMPSSALRTGAVDRVLPLEAIGPALVQMTTGTAVIG